MTFPVKPMQWHTFTFSLHSYIFQTTLFPSVKAERNCHKKFHTFKHCVVNLSYFVPLFLDCKFANLKDNCKTTSSQSCNTHELLFPFTRYVPLVTRHLHVWSPVCAGRAASISLNSNMRVQPLCVSCMLANVSYVRILPKVRINYP